MTKQKKSILISFMIGFVILVGLDQWTKGLVVAHLKGHKPFVVWDGVFEFYYSENRGAAFGSAGAVGNMIDRISQGYVVDFLYFKLINFPIFNVADCYVTIAAACLVILIMFYYKDEDMACFAIKKHGNAEKE